MKTRKIAMILILTLAVLLQFPGVVPCSAAARPSASPSLPSESRSVAGPDAGTPELEAESTSLSPPLASSESEPATEPAETDARSATNPESLTAQPGTAPDPLSGPETGQSEAADGADTTDPPDTETAADPLSDTETTSSAPQSGTDEPSGSEVPPAVQTLTIQRHTGLPGSDTYETAATYTYEELKERSFWEDDYTCIDPAIGVIIDHAQGVALKELLTDAGIDPDSAVELIFLSDDAQLPLPAADLLDTTRYCHFSLPDHYDDGSYGTDPMIGLFHQRVETILAVQDHWMPVSEGGMFWSDPAGMTADNAFRLVFGQADITESKAAASLSHIHTIRVLTDTNLTDPPEEPEDSPLEPGTGDASGTTTEQDGDSPVSGESPEQDPVTADDSGAFDPPDTVRNLLAGRFRRTQETAGTSGRPAEEEQEHSAPDTDIRENPEPPEQNRDLPDDEGALVDQRIQSSDPAPSVPESRALMHITTPALSTLSVTDSPPDDQQDRESENDNQAVPEQQSLSLPGNSSTSPESGNRQTAATPPASRNSVKQNTFAGYSSSVATNSPTTSDGRVGIPRVQEVLLNEQGTSLDLPTVGSAAGSGNAGSSSPDTGTGAPDASQSAVPSGSDPAAATDPSTSTQSSRLQDQPAGIGGDGFRIYEMTPVSPEGEFHDHGFVLEEYTIDTRQVLWLFLVIFFLPAAVGLVYYVKRFLMGEREHQDEQKEGPIL